MEVERSAIAAALGSTPMRVRATTTSDPKAKRQFRNLAGELRFPFVAISLHECKLSIDFRQGEEVALHRRVKGIGISASGWGLEQLHPIVKVNRNAVYSFAGLPGSAGCDGGVCGGNACGGGDWWGVGALTLAACD